MSEKPSRPTLKEIHAEKAAKNAERDAERTAKYEEKQAGYRATRERANLEVKESLAGLKSGGSALKSADSIRKKKVVREVKTVNLIVQDYWDKKKLEKLLKQGWEIQETIPRAMLRGATYIFFREVEK